MVLDSQLAAKYGTIDLNYSSLNPIVPDHVLKSEAPIGAPHFIETEDDLLLRCSKTFEKLLEYSDGENFAIVSHAPCNQAIALHLEGVSATGVENSKIGAWPLGGVTKFTRPIHRDENTDAIKSYGDWKMEFFGDTQHMPGKYQVGMKVRVAVSLCFCLFLFIVSNGPSLLFQEWSLPCLAEGTIQDGASFDGSFF